MTEAFLNKTEQYCRQNNLLPHGGEILAAVSGGCDSMCLLHTLLKLSGRFGFTVSAAHFNHMLRGAESDRDERFVNEQCASLGIPCYTGRADVHAESKRRKKGVEETARTLRYAYFEKLCLQRGILRIATAHSADDNAETVLLNLVRGAGIAGLGGIPPRRGNVIRPLLCATRAEIEVFLNENNIPHVEDSTNSEDDYTRNRIRHCVIPVLRGINPSLAGSIRQTSELMRADEKYLSGLAAQFIAENSQKAGRLPAAELLALGYPVASRVIRQIVPGISKKHTDMVLSLCESTSPGASIDLPGVTVRREYADIVIGGEEPAGFSPFELRAGDAVEIAESALKITCEKTVFSPNIHNSFNNFVLKYDTIQGAVAVRPRMSGDSISLIGRDGTKSLKKLYIDGRIPRLKRPLVPVIADSLGVLAVYGFGVDKRARASYGDTVLNIKIEEII